MDFIAVTIAVVRVLRKQSDQSQVQSPNEDSRQYATPVNYVPPASSSTGTHYHHSDASFTDLLNENAANRASLSRGVPVRIALPSSMTNTRLQANHMQHSHLGPLPPVFSGFLRVGGQHRRTRNLIQTEQHLGEMRDSRPQVVAPPRYSLPSPPPPYQP